MAPPKFSAFIISVVIFILFRLSSRDNSQPLLKKRVVPDHLLEPRYDEDTESSMPDDFLLVMNSIRVFVHIDKSLFAKLCQKLETITLETGEPLFRVGESDENIFVVHSGKLRVSITEPVNAITRIAIFNHPTQRKL